MSVLFIPGFSDGTGNSLNDIDSPSHRPNGEAVATQPIIKCRDGHTVRDVPPDQYQQILGGLKSYHAELVAKLGKGPFENKPPEPESEAAKEAVADIRAVCSGSSPKM